MGPDMAAVVAFTKARLDDERAAILRAGRVMARRCRPWRPRRIRCAGDLAEEALTEHLLAQVAFKREIVQDYVRAAAMIDGLYVGEGEHPAGYYVAQRDLAVLADHLCKVARLYAWHEDYQALRPR